MKVPLPPPAPAASYPAIDRARAWFDPVLGSRRVQAVDAQKEVVASITGAPAQALVDAVQGALDYASDTGRLQPITNRHLNGVLDMLRGNENLRTGNPKLTYASHERRASIRLPGEESIPINYALLQVRPEIEHEETLEKVPNMGQVTYGGVALVLKPDVLRRSTFTEADSIGVVRTFPPEGIANATAAAVLRRAKDQEPQLSHQVGRAHSEWLERVVDSGHPTAEQLSIALAQAPITSFDNRGLPPVPEVQIYGGVSPRDVAAIRVQDGAPAGAIDALRAAAEPYGIPVEIAGPIDARGRISWLEDLRRGGVRITPARTERAATGKDWDELAALWKPAK